MRGAGPPSALQNLWRVLLSALAIAVVLELLYVASANLLLASGVLERQINADPDELHVELDRPWTVLPGRVKLARVAIRVQDRTSQFHLDLSDVTVQLNLWSLIERKLHATHVHVERTAFRFRSKIEDTPRERRLAAAYPPIAGFADPPVRKPWPSGPQGKIWTVQLEDVATGVGEVWVQQFHYTGAGRATGSFLLKPTQRIWLEDARVTLADAPLRRGRSGELFSRFHLDLKGRLPDRSLVGLEAIDLLRSFHGESSIRAQVASLDFLHAYLPDERLRLRGGHGPLASHLKLAGGRLLPGSRTRYETDAVGVHGERFELSGDADVHAEVTGTATPSGTLTIEARDVSLASAARPSRIEAARVRRHRIELVTETLDVGEPWKIARGSLTFPQIAIPDVRLLNDLVAPHPTWQLLHGSARGSVKAEIVRSGRLQGTTRWQLDRARARFGGVGVSANARLSLGLIHDHVDRSRGTFHDAELVLSDLALATRDGTTGRGEVRVAAKRVPYDGFAPRRVDARVEAAFEDAEPVLAALGITRGTLPKILADVLDLSHLRVIADVHHGGSSTDLLLHQARTDAVSARGVWRDRGRQSDGVFVLTPSIAKTARTGVLLRNGESSVHFLVGRDWLQKEARERGLPWPAAAATPRKSAGHTPRSR